jgi:hypothetical protein
MSAILPPTALHRTTQSALHTFSVGRAVRVSIPSPDIGESGARARPLRSGILPRCGPAEQSVSRRSIGSTRFYISSKRHPISPFRISNEASFDPLLHPVAMAVELSCRDNTYPGDLPSWCAPSRASRRLTLSRLAFSTPRQSEMSVAKAAILDAGRLLGLQNLRPLSVT